MKILVGFDGSNVSKEAIALAERHAAAFNAELIIAQSMVGGPEVPRKDFQIAENSLEHEKNQLLDKNIPCESILSVRGLEAGEDLVQMAEEKKSTKLSSVCVGGLRSASCFSAPPPNM